MSRKYLTLILFFVSTSFCDLNHASFSSIQESKNSNKSKLQTSQQELSNLFYDLLRSDHIESIETLKRLDKNWDDAFYAPLVEVLRFSRNRPLRKDISTLLSDKSNEKFGTDAFSWFEWLWQSPKTYQPFYADFKARIHEHIDPKFSKYFHNRNDQSTIRLDEILWGGVVQDGIPPLRLSEFLNAEDADYLSNDDIVFGVNLNGFQKAYPKRILGWHEMIIDNFGNTEIVGVYCTLCGTMIAYNTEVNGERHQLGTSGFLYRSNKLMYDKKTQSLWNTIEGKPVVGPLVNKDIELQSYSVVTSTWKEWKKQYPDTKVLSLNTGYYRDYSTGAAYKEYYATDKLMFPVPLKDNQLKNKDEVLVIKSANYYNDPIAISIKYLNKNKVYHNNIGEINFVVITNPKGGSRVFEARDYNFESFNDSQLVDSENQTWTVGPDYIKNEKGVVLKQLPSHNIFWFAWYNAFPKTRLIK